MKDYPRQRIGKAAGERPDPIDDSAFVELLAMDTYTDSFQGDSSQEAMMTANGESTALELRWWPNFLSFRRHGSGKTAASESSG